MFYAVIPLGSARRQRFTYSTNRELVKGQVVTVPFGKRDRIAVVAGPAEPLEVARPIGNLQPWRLPATVVDLIIWTADTYLAPTGSVAKLVLPEYLTGQTDPTQASGESTPHDREATREVVIQRRRLARYRAALQNTGRFLLLVPEIALAESLGELERETGAVRFHSRLTPSERITIWEGVLSGRITKVIGTRAALWLPWPALDTVIVDEEDDRAYKSERTPRYHARSVASRLASLHRANLLLGSAAPSLESWQHGSAKGWQMTIEQEDFPTISRTGPDTRQNPLDSESLEALQKPGRHMIWAPERMHHHIVQALERELPDTPVTIFKQTYGSQVALKKFTAQPAGIIIGSTALTHPWDFETSVVVATGIDGLLQLADFRAAERAHGILRKLAAHAPDSLIIQTANPDHPAIDLLGRDPASFYSQEATERTLLKLPPAVRLTRLTASPRTPKPERQAYLSELESASLSVREIKPGNWLVKGDPLSIPYPPPPGWQVDVDTLNPL